MNYLERLNKLCERREIDPERMLIIEKLIDKINKHAWIPISTTKFAAKLINERMDDRLINHNFFNNLSTDKSSISLFETPRTDPSEAIIMVDINYLSRNKGNDISQSGSFKSVDSILKLIKSKKKLSDVILFSLRKNKVEEGNHRVEALKQLGYKSAPVRLIDSWD